MLTFALLSGRELRLVDRMFDAGVFRDVPALAQPPAEGGRDGSRTRSLLPLASQIEATARRVGDVVEHGSIDELLRIAEQRDGERRPDGGAQT